MFHYYLKGERTWPVLLGVLSETAGDLGAIVEELLNNKKIYSHYAHWNGLVHGVFIAFVLDLFQNKKDKIHPFWYGLPLTFGAMIIRDKFK